VPVALVVVLAIVALPVLDVAVGRNFHVVVRGTCYRCAQPSVEQLRADVRYRGVRTVINLRGDCAPEAWYEDERRAARELGIEFVDVGLWASQPPPPEEIRRLVQALDHSPRPILLHCLRGSDRTGLASAVVLLLLTDADPAAARRQLGICYGHLARGNWLAMDRFFDQYEIWLRDRGQQHTSDRFRRWACEEYAVPMPRYAVSGP
jgi:protein tyrosine phosphatase (PTP) superfamily phosphohydrolase (DUF442 family)